MDCKSRMPMPCIPVVQTPSSKGFVGLLADYAPSTSPMIPALVIHCVSEIERRCMNHKGLYRVNGSDSQVKELKVNAHDLFVLGNTLFHCLYEYCPVSGSLVAWKISTHDFSSGRRCLGQHSEVIPALAQGAARYLYTMGKFYEDRRHGRRNGCANGSVFSGARITSAEPRHFVLHHSPPTAVI